MSNNHSSPRCAVLVGPYASGKTTLFEELLFAAGAIDRRGTVKDGTTVSDASDEARARSMSVELSVASFQYLDEPWTLIDCPGSVELSYDAQCAMVVADLVIVVCEPQPERAAAISRQLKFLDEHAIPHLVFINKMDQQDASARATLEALQAHSSRPLVLREIPLRGEGGQVVGMVDLVSERAWRWNAHKPSDLIRLPDRMKPDEQSARDVLLETLADFDDRLMEKLLEDAIPSTSEIYETLTADLQRDLVVPVLFGSAENGNGVHRLLKAMRHEAPEVAVAAKRQGVTDANAITAEVFKTVYAGQSGKLSYVRVWAGEVREGMSLGLDRVGSVMGLFGAKTTAKGSAIAGEVVALSRMASAATGDLLGMGPAAARNWPKAPPPMSSLAIRAVRQTDEVKLTSILTRLIETDPALQLTTNPETGEQILSGQGDLHLKIALARLQAGGLGVSTAVPAVAYRETISQAATQHSRHKKQSGGHGEFADVHLQIKPLPRGSGFQFEDRITGGVVPKQYIPAVETGVRTALARGPLGYPVVDLAVTLTDGTFHSVDSSDMAFQKAAGKAMAEALPLCAPVLLEPVMKVTVSAPTEFTPKMQRIVTNRRSQILGFDAKPGWQGWDEVVALIPQAELGNLAVELRSQSMGTGSYVCTFDHLREMQAKDAERVVAEAAK
ncbi:MAG: elongation factor G [Cypionkella sp.]